MPGTRRAVARDGGRVWLRGRRSGTVRAFVALVALATVSGADSSGVDPPPSSATAGAPRVLFDGKTLDGWKTTGFPGASEVRVVDGALVLKAGRPMSGVTSTRTDLPRTDYELTYEAMRLDGRDFFAAATFPVGASYVTLVNGGWGGTVTGLSSINGADASENETGRSFAYKDKTWYRFRVRVTARAIRAWIGDQQVVGVVHEDRQLRTRIETRANQPLGFATWETSGSIRNVTVRPLTPAEVAETNKFEND